MNLSLQVATTYVDALNDVVRGANGVDYAYRQLGSGAVPLVLLQHFRGDLDNWDPSLVDALAANHRVVAFDNVGVGMSSGVTPSTVKEMARDAITFLDAMTFDQVDVLGFSLGSFVAQEIALIRPAVVRRLVLASSAPEGAVGMLGWAPEVIAAVGKPQRDPDGYLSVFFTSSKASQQAGRETLQRISRARTDARDMP
jgi:pimeloyl-ACP methyl ester carboxylesterase